MVGTTIAVGFTKYASYCGLIFMDKRHTMKSTKIYTPQKFLRVRYTFNINFISLTFQVVKSMGVTGTVYEMGYKK